MSAAIPERTFADYLRDQAQLTRATLADKLPRELSNIVVKYLPTSPFQCPYLVSHYTAHRNREPLEPGEGELMVGGHIRYHIVPATGGNDPRGWSGALVYAPDLFFKHIPRAPVPQVLREGNIGCVAIEGVVATLAARDKLSYDIVFYDPITSFPISTISHPIKAPTNTGIALTQDSCVLIESTERNDHMVTRYRFTDEAQK